MFLAGYLSSYVCLFLWPRTVSQYIFNSVELFLWGPVWLFWVVSWSSVFAVCLAIPLTVSGSVSL